MNSSLILILCSHIRNKTVDKGNLFLKLLESTFNNMFGLQDELNPFGVSLLIETMCPPIVLPFIGNILRSTHISSSLLLIASSESQSFCIS